MLISRQSERNTIYQEEAQRLIENGHGYRCFCSQERLQKLATKGHSGTKLVAYDRACASISASESSDRASKGEAHVIRLKMTEQDQKFIDLIYGQMGAKKLGPEGSPGGQKDIGAYEDPILIKSDALPTYHLANVVDDHYMNVTHVIRATVRSTLSRRD